MDSSWDLLDPEREVDLHKSRLLNVEEKPFKRITKRLNTLSSIALPDAQNGSATENSQTQIEQLKEELTLDFAAFDSSITRLQFLHHANTRERERYTADQHRILTECQAVRASNAQLREQLKAAQETLAQRKKFDELAEKITSNRLLRPRKDQVANLSKLEEECRELERETETYKETWRERKEQFNKIMEEGMELRRQIRDEKEEVDRREGMNEGDDDEVEADKTGQTPRHEPSGDATPRPDGDAQSKADGEGGTTPNPDASRDTPAPDTLKPPHHQGSRSRSGSQVLSRDASPLPPHDDSKNEGRDVDMEDGEASDDDDDERPEVVVEPPEDKMEVDN